MIQYKPLYQGKGHIFPVDEKTLLALKQGLARVGLLPAAETLARWIGPSGKAIRRMQHDMTDFYGQFVKPGDVCFDVGANLGSRVEVFLRLGAKVIAVEPQENCIAYLHTKFAHQPQVVLIPKGLDSSEGERQIFISSNDSRMSSMSTDWMEALRNRQDLDLSQHWDKPTTVSVTTLDRLIADFGQPAFCKIDVEGYEYQVLSGLSQAIPALSFEFHSVYISTTRRCIEHLMALGTYQFNYCAAETMSFELPAWVDSAKMIDLLAQIAASPDASGDIYARRVAA